MRTIKNLYYRAVELYARLSGDVVTAEYYLAKREDNQ
ncbi:hypothetical protein SEA_PAULODIABOLI_256 [Microbacterium phage PauloDiaboli]|nr:hypothetical protein SEA_PAULODIABOLI_256 [Microbacterium phage PauloDiaboli]QWY84063.1 hypothetical protein SEA_A3WALLY_256 [Microbacterium phage A3Wally]